MVAEPSNRTKDPAMTDEMMTLGTLLEKSSDADLLREGLAEVVLSGVKSGAHAGWNGG
jgi:hypothetical protein